MCMRRDVLHVYTVHYRTQAGHFRSDFVQPCNSIRSVIPDDKLLLPHLDTLQPQRRSQFSNQQHLTSRKRPGGAGPGVNQSVTPMAHGSEGKGPDLGKVRKLGGLDLSCAMASCDVVGGGTSLPQIALLASSTTLPMRSDGRQPNPCNLK